MKKPIDISRLFFRAGICLLAAAGLLLIFWNGSVHIARQKAAAYVSALESAMPPRVNAVPEARQTNAMPVYYLDGKDFIGILEMPRYQLTLPVGNDWGEQFPCRFTGSVYDETIQIGATTQKGQFDFYRELTVGDEVLFTDMEGSRFYYQITDIRYARHADPETLQQKDGALVLFIQNIYALEYVILYCND